MTSEQLLRDLVAADVRLTVNGDRLRINAPEHILTDELKATLRERKPELLALLLAPKPVWPCREDIEGGLDWLKERAAIIETEMIERYAADAVGKDGNLLDTAAALRIHCEANTMAFEQWFRTFVGDTAAPK